MKSPSYVALLALFGIAAGALAFDDTEKTPANKPARSNKEATKPAVTPEMESVATQFVREHHAELAELLMQLKASNPSQYQQAIRDLSRSAATLATTAKNDPAKHDIDLKLWQVNSQIQVLAARLAMTEAPELEDELKTKLREQIDLRIEQQKYERDRTEARLKRLNDSIARLEKARDQEANKAFDRLTKTTPKPGSKRDKKTANTKKPATDKPKTAP